MNAPTHRLAFRRPPQRGATLIEVLVSILLMALGVLAMAALQINAVQYSKTSEYRTLATLLANDLGDRMRANHPVTKNLSTGYNYATSGSYAEPSKPAAPANLCSDPATACTFDEMAALDLYQWRKTVYEQLPKGTARVNVSNTTQGVYADIWLVWTDPKSGTGQNADACPTGFGQPNTVRCVYFRIAV